jgi:hypothetical protein
MRIGMSTVIKDASELVDRVYQACAARANAEPPRSYLGMSSIGDPCERKLWLAYHGAPRKPITGTKARVFANGHAVEARVVADLKAAGFGVDGQQLEFSDFSGRFRGHCDGVIHGVTAKPHVLEIKSANDENFKKFVRHGVESSPAYAAQVQCYMGYAGLQRTLFVVENKNNQKLYMERVRFEPARFESIRLKAWRILEAGSGPEGARTPLCARWCDYETACG